MEKSKNPNKVGVKNMIMWQSRAVSIGANLMILGFLSIYCTDTLKMPAALVGTLLMVSKIFDGVTDIFAGYLVDKTNTRWGRGRPYEWSVIGLWLCTVLIFICPTEFSMFAKGAWIFCMYSLVNAVFVTLLNANQTPYMVRAFNNQQKYVALSTYGSIITMLCIVVVNVLLPTLVENIATSPEGWRTLILIFSIPMALIGMLRFFFVKEVYNVDTPLDEKLRIADVITVLKKNKYIYIIAALTLVYNIVTNMGINTYYFTYIVKDLSLMGILSLTQIILLPLVFSFSPLIKKFSVRKLIMAGLVFASVGGVFNFIAYDNFTLLIIGALLQGIGNVPISMLTGLLIIECAEFNEWKKLPRLEGTLSSINGFAAKIGAAFGVFLVGVMLTASNYTGDAVTMPDSAIMMMRMLMGLIPTVFYLAVCVILGFYKLDALIPKIREENAAARAASN